ncbi:MFS transporter [Maledivibacter halophilus]|uniref:Major Facilitator Superfamily protein n=1 Tax=Maledivibacter halophilus TaxID=36842 RepID=A0A1T5MJU4_9FIRM|nr:MFS transporter [Maledivibacter halophilus]SKC88214.1 Major Facilitator Superfamily protein [Maledivibacter halophilus]
MKSNRKTAFDKELIKNKDFFILLLGRFISLSGSMLQSFGFSIYVLEQTGSGYKFATVLVLSGLTSLFFTPIAGVLSDWFNKKRIMVVLDFFSGFFLLAILGYSLAYGLSYTEIYFVVVVLAIVTAIYSPAVDSAIPFIVAHDKLLSANSINNFIVTASRILGPIMGGVLYYIIQVKGIILMNALSFIISAIMELFMQIPSKKKKFNTNWKSDFFKDLKDGLLFVYREKNIFVILLFCTLVNLIIMPIGTVGFPFIVNITLNLTSRHFGISEAALAIGILIGSMLTGVIISKFKIRLEKVLSYTIIVASTLILFIGLIINPSILQAIGKQTTFVIFTIFVFLIGMTFTAINISMPTYIQQRTPKELLGRVVGLVGTLLISTAPIGQMIYGVLFDAMPTFLIIIISALIMLVLGLLCRNYFRKIDKVNG